MCGILFHVYSQNKKEIPESKFRSALATMKNRGPDHQALVQGSGFVAGHARLAIIDLSPEANQPFWDSTGRYVLTYNGEIYNFPEIRKKLIAQGVRLKTQSDTETLLESILKFGLDETLRSLRGMFAFVLHDTQTGFTQGARDHFGQKPLYYTKGPSGITFASNVNALLQVQEKTSLKTENFATYLCSRGILLPEETFFAGIHNLPAGHKFECKNNDIKINEYFSPASLLQENLYRENAELSQEELLERLGFLLGQAIDRHLLSDVPVGVLLSGGIDSSLVYALAHQRSKKLTAFTKITPGIESIPSAVVPQILEKYPSPWISNVENVPEYLPSLFRFIAESGAPARWGGGPPMQRLCQAARQEGTLVLLGGDCVDEYFAGYDSQAATFDEFRSEMDLGGQVGLNSQSPFFFQSPNPQNYLNRQLELRKNILTKLAWIEDPKERFLQASLLQDTQIFLQTCGLPNSDAYSMAASVELRNPLLDLDLLSFVVNLPGKWKLSPPSPGVTHRNKNLLRTYANQVIGKFIDVAKEGTRNYSMKISEPGYWNLSRFSVQKVVKIPGDLKPKDLFKVINLELFHRIYAEGESSLPLELLTPEGQRALVPAGKE